MEEKAMPYVLIVDDDPDLSECNAEALRRAGHEVRVAATPQAGMAAIQERHPDLILLDVMFPDNDTGGFELARKIPMECPRVPILMMTSVNQHFPLNFGNKDKDPLWLPISEFLDKPVDPQVLVQKVKEAIQRAKQASV
jgi:DNA-binding response OmpR family regulator